MPAAQLLGHYGRGRRRGADDAGESPLKGEAQRVVGGVHYGQHERGGHGYADYLHPHVPRAQPQVVKADFAET